MLDKGNHYYKCDLQCHTPRDRNWDGSPAVSDEQRSSYASAFIKRCRVAGLDAIAITDHHDLCLFPYIREAANNELDESGNLVLKEKRLVVFPGIELTLSSPPCQGLLILDADFPESLFPTVLGTLSLAQADTANSKTAETIAIPSSNISSINDIYSKLDGTDGLKGRYVFFPHVKQGGHQTLLRQNFHHAYANMPSVGGYIDGKLNNPSTGFLNIVSGKTEAYGFKSIAVLQTSDHRSEKPFPEDSAATWIKFKQPTAEALRQACLAKESRISLDEPEIPNIFIEKIDVTHSVFLSNFEIDFNPQLNSIIGGRGSGKSTILEYLRWCLCDQTTSTSFDISDTLTKRRNSLIEKTLASVNGEVRVFFSVNGTRHIIKRSPASEDVLLKIGDGDFQSVRPDQVRSLLPIQAYSQKQLSNVAVKSSELKRLIEQPISEEIKRTNKLLKHTSSTATSTYRKLREKDGLVKEITKLEVETVSFKQQIEKLRSSLKGITEEDRSILERAKFYTAEKNRFSEVDLEYERIQSALDETETLISSLSNKTALSSETIENISLIEKVEKERRENLENLKGIIEAAKQQHRESLSKIEEQKDVWQKLRDAFDTNYLKAKESSSSSEATLKSIKELESKIDSIELSIRQKRSELEQIDVDEGSFSQALTGFYAALQEQLDILKNSAGMFTELSGGMIGIDFTKILDSAKLANDLGSIFSTHKLNIPATRSETIADQVGSAPNQIECWARYVDELRGLVEKREDIAAATPLLDEAGFTAKNKQNLMEGLTSDGLVQIATILLSFVPKFLYKTNNQMGDTVPFEEASAGQQATALLNVLLNQDGYPLVIDQPEDDIDNRAIEKIIESLWESKKSRQIIVSSHNANLVVNGDSELVISCDYNESSEQTRGKIKHEGSIDDEAIRQEITTIMEGGEKAFKLRKEKYGF